MDELMRFVFTPSLMESSFEDNPILEHYRDIIEKQVRRRLETDIYYNIFSNIMHHCGMEIYHIALIDNKVNVWATKRDDTSITQKDINEAYTVITEDGPDLWMEGDINAVTAEYLAKYGMKDKDANVELDPELVGMYLERSVSRK